MVTDQVKDCRGWYNKVMRAEERISHLERELVQERAKSAGFGQRVRPPARLDKLFLPL